MYASYIEFVWWWTVEYYLQVKALSHVQILEQNDSCSKKMVGDSDGAQMVQTSCIKYLTSLAEASQCEGVWFKLFPPQKTVQKRTINEHRVAYIPVCPKEARPRVCFLWSSDPISSRSWSVVVRARRYIGYSVVQILFSNQLALSRSDVSVLQHKVRCPDFELRSRELP